MDRCQDCQDLLLDYLYDLLDGPELSSVQSHLATCAACKNALLLARRQQNLLATAARLECAGSFEIPSDEALPTPKDEPTLLPLPRRPKPTARPNRWPAIAAAASLLFIMGAALWLQADHAAARTQVETAQQARNQTRDALADNHQQQGKLVQDARKLNAAQSERERLSELQVRVTGPGVVAGPQTAPFRVETTDLAGTRVSAEVTARLVRRAADGKESQSLALIRDRKNPDDFRLSEAERLDPTADYQVVVSTQRPGGGRVTVPLDVEVVPTRFVTYLTTDRPLYEAGTDIVHFRSLTLDRRTLKPVDDELFLQYALIGPGIPESLLARGTDKLKDAGKANEIVLGPDRKPLRGVGAGSFPLEANLPAGEYTLAVRDLRSRFPETRSRFLIQRSGSVRLESGWEWSRPEYAPGQVVFASGRFVRATGEPLAGRPVVLTLTAEDGSALQEQTLRTDATGRIRWQSALPAVLTGPVGLVATIREASGTDIVRANVPVALPGAIVDFFPEGGDLIAGAECRVFFQTRDRRGRPCILVGELIEDGKPTGIVVRTTDLTGISSFRFTPRSGATYRVKVTTPAATPALTLPTVMTDGVALVVAESVVDAGQPLHFTARSATGRTLQATLTCRGEVLESLRLEPGSTKASFATRQARGVCRLTVYEEMTLLGHRLDPAKLAASLAGRTEGSLAAAMQLLACTRQEFGLVPRAERLVYCQPSERLDIDLRADQMEYRPNQTAKIQVQAVDEFRKAVPAVVQVVVIDRAALAGADERLSRSLPANAWLAAELKSPEMLERADALLLPATASRQALDGVLATQGWRRFVPAVEPVEATDEERLVTAQARLVPDYTTLARERDHLKSRIETQQRELIAREEELTSQANTPALLAAQDRLAWFHQTRERIRQGLNLALVALAILFALVGIGYLLLGQARRSPVWLTLSGVAFLLLVNLLGMLHPFPLGMELAALPTREKADDVARLADLPGKEGFAETRGIWAEAFGRDLSRANNEGRRAGQGGGGILPDQDNNRDSLNRNTGRVLPGRMAPMAALAQMGGFGQANKPGTNLQAEAHFAPEAAKSDKRADGPLAKLREQLMQEKGEAKKEAEALNKPLAEQEQELRQRSLVVRTFANADRKQVDARAVEWTPMVFWHPVLVLPGEGTTIEFQLGAKPTRYRIDVQAHGLDGRLGNVRKELEIPAESK